MKDLSRALYRQRKPDEVVLPMALHLACLQTYGVAAAVAEQWTMWSGYMYVQRLLEVQARPGVTGAIRCMYDRELRRKWSRLAESGDPEFDVNIAVNQIDEELLAQCKRQAEAKSKGGGKAGDGESKGKGKGGDTLGKGKSKGKGYSNASSSGHWGKADGWHEWDRWREEPAVLRTRAAAEEQASKHPAKKRRKGDKQ